MVDSNSTISAYKIPSHEILKKRRKFYGSRKEVGESVERWLKRVQLCIDYCEFPKGIIEFLLIDRYICELNDNELKAIERVDTWSVEQLLRYYLNDQNVKHTASIAENDAVDEDVKVGPGQLMEDGVDVEFVSLLQKCE